MSTSGLGSSFAMGLLLVFSLLPSVSHALQGQTRVGTAGAASPVEPSTTQIAASATPATVTIITFDQGGDTLGLGSGFLVQASGVIVTNFHVVRRATSAVVILANGERYGRVEAVDADSSRDVAVLKVPGYGLPTLTSTPEVPPPGAKVIAIGSPHGLVHTVTEGIVSAKRIVAGRELIQISASISPGSSGGPVLDTQGRVFAIATSQIAEGQQLNFAVPVRYALGLVTEPVQVRSLTSLSAPTLALFPRRLIPARTNDGSDSWEVDSSEMSAVYEERSYVARLRAVDSSGVVLALVCKAGAAGYMLFQTPAALRPSSTLLFARFPTTRISYRFGDRKAKTGLLALPESTTAAWTKGTRQGGGLPWDAFLENMYYSKWLTVAFEGMSGERVARFALPKKSGDLAQRYVAGCKE